MYIVLWILLCFFACVGVVQMLSWLLCRLGRPGQTSNTYQVIALEREPGPLEAQLRYEIHLLRWGTPSRADFLVLLDTGLCDEAKAICRNLLCGVSGAMVCRPEDLPGLIVGTSAAKAV